MMKKTFVTILALICFLSPVIADAAQALSRQAMEEIEQQVREMSAFGVKEAQAQKMLTQMFQNRFESRIVNQARQEVINAARAGLPTEPMMNKALEGITKKANPQAVIAAMQAVRSRYAHADQVAKSLSRDTKTIGRVTHAVADSLAAGMKTEDMEAVRAQLQIQQHQHTRNQDQSEALALQTMQTVRTMAQLGIRSKDVADTVCRALRNAYTERQMEQMRHQVSEQSRQMPRGQIDNQFSNGRIGSDAGKGGTGGNSGAGSGGSGGGSGGGGGGDGGGGGGGGR